MSTGAAIGVIVGALTTGAVVLLAAGIVQLLNFMKDMDE